MLIDQQTPRRRESPQNVQPEIVLDVTVCVSGCRHAPFLEKRLKICCHPTMTFSRRVRFIRPVPRCDNPQR
jgi:hypothetical protein